LVGGMAVEPLPQGKGLIAGAADLVYARQEFVDVRHIGQIPANMFARGTYAGEFPVKPVMLFEMVQQAVAQLAVGRWLQVASCFQKMADFAEYPGASLRRTPHHYRV